jgi:nitrogen fixation protein FixH
MTQTLFGGMLLITVLFFVLGLFKLPTFWRGVVSAALPTLGMIAYSMQHWQGGDVMAIHLAIYLTTAAVLVLVFGQHQGKRFSLHWVPVTIIVFFVVLSALMASFLSIATHGLPPGLAKLLLPHTGNRPIYTAFSGEVPHDEEAAKTVSQYMKKAQQQKALGWRITVDGLDGIQINETRSVSVAIIDAADQPLNNASVHIALLRPGARQAAQQWTLHNTVSTGNYSAALKIGEAGKWLALISITRGQDKFETAKEIIVAAQSQ